MAKSAREQAVADGFKDVKAVRVKDGKLVFPEGAEIKTVQEDGRCLCEYAANAGLRDCAYLREINTHLKDKATLKKGDRVAIPEKRQKSSPGKDKTNLKSKRPVYPPPMVWFIKEDGVGYVNPPAPVAGPDGKLALKPGDRHFPRRPGQGQFNVTNYHVDKTADGTKNFADANTYGHDKDSSDDPDHFKVQVYDNTVPTGTDTVTVTLHAMRPSYRKQTNKGVEYVFVTTNYRYPASNDRKLQVTCKRIPDTNYFRSPYLRLVTTETDHTARDKQTLLVKDYWDDGADDIEKRYSEILHQKVRAGYFIQYCKPKKCWVYKDATLKVEKEVRLAIHILDGSTATLPQVREQIYKWMRRCLAQAHVRPHVKFLRRVAVPKNMITISDEHGRFATGKDKSDARKMSHLSVKIGGVVYKYPATGKTWEDNKSPMASARGLKSVLENAGFTVDGPHRVKVDGLSPGAGVSSPADMLVFNKDKSAANIASVDWTDEKQTIILTDDININIVIDYPYQKRKTRAVWRRWKTNYFDIFVGGADINPGPQACWGVAQLGKYDGRKYDIGPSCFVCEGAMDPAQKVFNCTHEMMHALMHVAHTQTDTSKGGTEIGKYEIMNTPTTSGADTKDGTKHIADAPNKAVYDIFHGAGADEVVTLDGTKHTFADKAQIEHTPVTRFHVVGGHYGLVGAPLQRCVNDERS